MTSSNTFIMDPDALLDFSVDWSAWSEGIRTVTDATITVSPEGLDKEGDVTIDDNVVTQKFSGGTLGVRYTVGYRIETAGGLIDERSIYITIRDR